MGVFISAMTPGAGISRRFLAALIGCVCGVMVVASPAEADLPEIWERWERLHGVGWGDGYHVRAPSPSRPWADLPPLRADVPARHRPPHPLNPRTAIPRATYYDRFDALRAAPDPASIRQGRRSGTRRPAIRIRTKVSEPQAAVPAEVSSADNSSAAWPDSDWSLRHDRKSTRVARVPEHLLIRQPSGHR